MKVDTIAAIATGMSQAGIGIVRISGPDAFKAAAQIFKPVNKEKDIITQGGYTVHYGSVYDDEQLIDEALLLLMRNPRSYTGEDTAEIHCHGGLYVVKKILNIVLKQKVRPAEPGEFTKRAFLNGKLDLSQAEAVIDVINSSNEYALNNSVSQLKGRLSDKVRQLRQQVLHETAFIEAALDDPEHYSLDGYPQELAEKIKETADNLKALIDSYDNGRIITEGVKTVILGKPNAGKSSLLNSLLGEERAIVTEIEGTTRDTLEERMNLNGISLLLIDTAGIRNTQDIVEKIGVSKAYAKAREADLILYVADASTPLQENDKQIIEFMQDKKAICLINKTDLESFMTIEEWKKITNKLCIPYSVTENIGFEELSEAVTNMFLNKEIDYNDEVMLTSVRQKHVLTEAYNSLLLVLQSIELGMSEDFYSIDLMNAYENMGYFLGEAVEDDLVNEIFTKFCMGK